MKKILFIFIIFFTAIFTTGAGYMGTLPDIESEFGYLKKEKTETAMPSFSVEELDKQNEEELRPIPREDENYVDIIIKKDKTSQYTKDVNSVILIMEKLRKCLNTDGDIQKFNAIVSNLIDHIAYIQEEYKDKPESEYLSYSRLIMLSKEARNAANFWMKKQMSKSYIPLTSEGNKLTDDNLSNILNSLLNNVNDTIFTLRNLE